MQWLHVGDLFTEVNLKCCKLRKDAWQVGSAARSSTFPCPKKIRTKESHLLVPSTLGGFLLESSNCTQLAVLSTKHDMKCLFPPQSVCKNKRFPPTHSSQTTPKALPSPSPNGTANPSSSQHFNWPGQEQQGGLGNRGETPSLRRMFWTVNTTLFALLFFPPRQKFPWFTNHLTTMHVQATLWLKGRGCLLPTFFTC